MQGARSDYFALLIKRGNEIFQYEISDQYTQDMSGFGAGDYEYFGYLTTTGAYILQRHQISTGQFRYVAGTSRIAYGTYLPFASNLTPLGNLSWGTYETIFG